MPEKPILFSDPMIQAIRGDRKWQTRRAMKPQPELSENGRSFIWLRNGKIGVGLSNNKRKLTNADISAALAGHCPLGKAGDFLWVRECHGEEKHGGGLIFRADGGWAEADGFAKSVLKGGKWKPSIFMKRKDSRIKLRIRGIRVERLLDINERDAAAEGAVRSKNGDGRALYSHDPSSRVWFKNARSSFLNLWARINGKAQDNPWVWVIEFNVVQE